MTKQEIIQQLKNFFVIEELVCPDVVKKFGEKAWGLFDKDILEALLWVRVNLGKKIIINTYKWGGKYSQRGLRCNLCSLVREKVLREELYVSAHILAKAFDYDVEGMTAEEVRQFLLQHTKDFPVKIRLEKGVGWVHMDTYDNGGLEKVSFFNA